MKPAITIYTFLIILLTSFGVQAQNSEAVTSELTLFKITTENGEERLTQITEVQPGDTVEYQLVYTNNLNSSISDLKPVLPVPDGVVYLANTAQPNLFAASLRANNVGLEQLPITREVTQNNGEIINQEVPARQYGRLQWEISSLNGGQQVTLKARMRVESNN